MRIRNGNPHDEAHGKALRVYEFVADGAKTPLEAIAAIELGTGLRLRADPLGQHGYVNWSRRPGGALWLAVILYEDCPITSGCASEVTEITLGVFEPSGHRRQKLVRAADLSPAQRVALNAAVGEHPQHRLTGTPLDVVTLRALGFNDNDPPLRPDGSNVRNP